ncbi:MAG: HEPN domain-containing protein [Candidatus Freyarchaeota archaeon]|nr:HEPN domain-containing protein [Candidatus Jordarchaeia archaeon]MBS7269533.1 HEPN domain-containing protein [Candidatus Jordarchaeia archaeon]MBS7280258.1 HEPN domain-containing protein [Candidatus Jordarchaeia archaeon]
MTTGHSKELAKASLHRANKALNAAKILLDYGHLEDAISRAYYAIHHAARAILFIKGIKAKTHRGVISSFGEHIVKKEIIDKEFADILRKAFDLRQKSDYEIYAQFKKENVEEIINNAEKFISKIKEILGIKGLL